MCISWDISYFICTSCSTPPSLISHLPRIRQCLNQFCRVVWHQKHRYSSWNFVAIMCTSWVILYFLSTSGSRPPSSIFHAPWRRPVLIFVPLCCSMQKICGFRWNFTYIPSVMSGLSVSGFTSPFWFPVEFHWIVHRAMLLSATVTSTSSNTNAATLNCFHSWFTPFDSMFTKFITFTPKNHPHYLYFRWRNSMTGWTI